MKICSVVAENLMGHTRLSWKQELSFVAQHATLPHSPHEFWPKYPLSVFKKKMK
jgi:hypothetical protein